MKILQTILGMGHKRKKKVLGWKASRLERVIERKPSHPRKSHKEKGK